VNLGISAEILDQMFEGVYVVDNNRTILHWNTAAEELTGYSAVCVAGRRCDDNLLIHINVSGEIICRDGCSLNNTLLDGQVRKRPSFSAMPQGHRIPVTIRAIPLKDETGAISAAMQVFTRRGAVTRQEQLKELAQKAYLDTLTGLPNKQYIENKLRSILATEVPGENPALGLLFLELANHKEINDDFGMTAANNAIIVTARTIVENLEPGDIAARCYGGRIIIVSVMDKKVALLNWANKIKTLLQYFHRPGGGNPSESLLGGLVVKKGENAITSTKPSKPPSKPATPPPPTST
jgi:diguanylate cyclase (GGDEF)-like protein/PAS domain S-box-containing protein